MHVLNGRAYFSFININLLLYRGNDEDRVGVIKIHKLNKLKVIKG